MIWVEIERVIVASQVQSLQLAGERSDPALVSHNRKLQSLTTSLYPHRLFVLHNEGPDDQPLFLGPPLFPPERISQVDICN